MKTKNIAQQLVSQLNTRSENYIENTEMMKAKLGEIDKLLDLAEAGGGKAHHERLAKKGKMPIRERIIKVLVPYTHFLQITPLELFQNSHLVLIQVFFITFSS